MSILQMSQSGAVMILAVIAIRALTVNRLPKKTFLVLWGIVLLRLLVPFSIPSPLSLYSAVNYLPVTSQMATMPMEDTLPVTSISAADSAVPGPVSALSAARTNLSLWAALWLAGSVICLMYFAIAYIKCYREFLRSTPVKCDFATRWLLEHKTFRRIQLRQSESIAAPLTYGIFRPVILLPVDTDWINISRMGYILEHEYIHIRRFDAITKILLTSALCIHWFNPAVWWMYLLANRDMELSCDESVVNSFGERIKSEYALALIGMEERKSILRPFSSCFSKNAIEERITAIMTMKRATALTLAVAIVVVVSTTTVFATSAATVREKENTNTPNMGAVVQENPTPSQTTDEKTEEEDKAGGYAEYAQFGLGYDEARGRFLLNGEVVRYFEDQTLNRYFGAYTDGDDNVYALRDRMGVLTGLKTLDIKTGRLDIMALEYSNFGLKLRDTPTGGMELGGKPIRSFGDSGASFGMTSKSVVEDTEYEAVRDPADPGPMGIGRLIDIRAVKPEKRIPAAASSTYDGDYNTIASYGQYALSPQDKVEIGARWTGSGKYMVLLTDKSYTPEEINSMVQSPILPMGASENTVHGELAEKVEGTRFIFSVTDEGTLQKTLTVPNAVNYNLYTVAEADCHEVVGTITVGNKKIDLTTGDAGSRQNRGDTGATDNSVDVTAMDIMQRTGNWGYVEKYLPRMTDVGIYNVTALYNSKHSNQSEHKKASDYYN